MKQFCLSFLLPGLDGPRKWVGHIPCFSCQLKPKRFSTSYPHICYDLLKQITFTLLFTVVWSWQIQWCRSVVHCTSSPSEFLHKSIFGNFQTFIVSEQGKRSVSIVMIHFWKGTRKMQNIYLIKTAYLVQNKITCKLAYLGVKIMTLIQKDENVVKVVYGRVSE